MATNWLHLPFGYHSELSFRSSHFQAGQLLLPAYSDTDDCKYLRSSVFFHVRAGLQSEEADIPFLKKAYKAAVVELEGVRKLQSEWDQKGIPEKKYWVIKANVPEQTKQKSIHERLEEKKRGVEKQKKKERRRNKDRDCL